MVYLFASEVKVALNGLIVCTDEKKMAVAHRDVNSRNVLVKADLTCCLCDLGFAIQMEGAHYYEHGEQQHAETTSLTDVTIY